MPSLSGLLKLNSTAEQLVIWNVLGAFIGAYLGPFLRAAEYDVNEREQNVVLTPATVADMVLRGHMTENEAITEVAKSGVNTERLRKLVRNAGSPLAPEMLAAALRRKFIVEDAGNAEGIGYIQGIRQSDLQDKWAPVLKQLERREPSPVEPVTALVRNQVSPERARELFEQFGGDPEFFDLHFNNEGEGPSPVEAGVLANRGIIPWDGIGPDQTTFAQAVSESRFRNKWLAAYKELATYRPPPRTVTAMWREGSIDTAQATEMLLHYGVPAAVIPSYLTPKADNTKQKAKEATESLIVRLYTEKALSAEQLHDILAAHAYGDDDIMLIKEQADLDRLDKEANAAIAVVKNLYLNSHIDYNGAVTQLDTHHVDPQHRQWLLSLWDLEKAAGTKTLTVTQIIHAVSSEIISAQVGLQKLKDIGYTNQDAQILLETALGPFLQSATGQLGQLLSMFLEGQAPPPSLGTAVGGTPLTGPFTR